MQQLGYINIKVSDSSVEYDTEFSTEEVVFWLELLKSMIFEKMLDSQE